MKREQNKLRRMKLQSQIADLFAGMSYKRIADEAGLKEGDITNLMRPVKSTMSPENMAILERWIDSVTVASGASDSGDLAAMLSGVRNGLVSLLNYIDKPEVRQLDKYGAIIKFFVEGHKVFCQHPVGFKNSGNINE